MQSITQYARANNIVSVENQRMEDRDVIPDVLYEDVKSRHCALFAGAGVSTEVGPYSNPTFYDTIFEKSKFPKNKPRPLFPDLMQYFCEKVDGGQRSRLTREIIERIEMFAAPGEINVIASVFHRQVAEVPYFDRIVTTNWDPFFERALDILVPMVEDRDLSFWDDKKRQVLKIHGCVTRPYTLVATRDDYHACINRYPLVFNKLRDLMATKTFLFVGYSLLDEDFTLVFDEITQRLGPFRRLSFAVDPNASPYHETHWKKKGVRIIKTSGVDLLCELRSKLEAEGILPSSEFLGFLDSERRRITQAHLKREQRESPGAFLSAMYQDGLLHVLNDVLSGTALGWERKDFEQELAEDRKRLSRMIKKKDLVEIAYYTGRVEGLARFCARDTSTIPAYFDIGNIKPSRRYKKR